MGTGFSPNGGEIIVSGNWRNDRTITVAVSPYVPDGARQSNISFLSINDRSGVNHG